MAETIKDLRKIPYDELIRRHDAKAKSTVVGTSHYLKELERRDDERMTQTMIEYTRRIKYMTLLITIMTLTNVILIVYTLFFQ